MTSTLTISAANAYAIISFVPISSQK